MHLAPPDAIGTDPTAEIAEATERLQRFIDGEDPHAGDSPYAVDTICLFAERAMDALDADMPGVTTLFRETRAAAYRALCERQVEATDDGVRILSKHNSLGTIDYSLRKAAFVGADVSDLEAAFRPHYELEVAEFQERMRRNGQSKAASSANGHFFVG